MASKAVCIGINNDHGTEIDLAGCVDDAHDWSAVLAERGLVVRKLPDAQAGKAAIRCLITGAAAGDSLVITFSDPSTTAPDEGRDEPDGVAEGLCPQDIKQGNVLVDDVIHALFAQRTLGTRLPLGSDSRPSGTVTRTAPVDPEADGEQMKQPWPNLCATGLR